MDLKAPEQKSLRLLVDEVLLHSSRDAVLALLGALADRPNRPYWGDFNHISLASLAMIGDSLQLVSAINLSRKRYEKSDIHKTV